METVTCHEIVSMRISQGNSEVAARIIALTVTLLIALAIGFLTLTPISDPVIPGSDKLHHLLAFAALTIPASIVLPRMAIWVALSSMAFGAAIEVLQPHVGRSGEFLDFFADAAGCVLGAVLGVSISLLWRMFFQGRSQW
jgi:VanZ family protein